MTTHTRKTRPATPRQTAEGPSRTRAVPPLAVFALPALALVIAGCGGGGSADAPAEERAEAQPAAVAVTDQAVVDAVTGTARPVAQALTQTLGSNLQAAMAEGGPVGAMEFCNVEALPLTRQVTEEQGFTVARTSTRVRNPANAPDAAAALALAWYEDRGGEGDGPPPPLVQRLASGDYRFYQPLITQPLCLQCHGSASDLGPGVADALSELYPEDRAVGFEAGELRGLLHVTIPEGAAEVPVDPADR
jgi:hypothetical protein